MVEKTEEKKKGLTVKIPKLNLWMISTVILIGILAFVLAGGWTITGQVVSSDQESILSAEDAANKAIDWLISFYKANGANVEITLVSASETENGIYEFTIKLSSAQGEGEQKYYVTRDGKLFLPQAIETEEVISEQQTEIPKTDRPNVDLYIFSYCPAGTSALDSLAEAASLLKDSANFKVKFFSHMHGEHERQQNMIQECIQRVAPDKYWDYTKQYLEEVYQECLNTRTTDCDKEKSIALMTSVGINSDNVMDCVEQNGEAYYQQDIDDATNLQLRYSPSFVINGVYLSDINRSPEGIKSAVCSAFKTPPEDCSETLGTSGTSSGGQC